MRIWPVGEGAISGEKVTITGGDARHIVTVLRKGRGDILQVVGPDNLVYSTEIEEIGENSVIARINGVPLHAELKRPNISVAISICKQQAMEFAVQKCAELGCSGFYPIATERSLTPTLSGNRLERLKKIAHEAEKQSGRPEGLEVVPLGIDDLPPADLKLLLWEEERETQLREILSSSKNPDSVLVVIGPKSGLSSEEVDRFKEKGFRVGSLGGLVLRVETAVISVVSVLNYHYGRMESR
jgi:16S rRNA (uracil1498-N3)-methyltransferase